MRSVSWFRSQSGCDWKPYPFHDRILVDYLAELQQDSLVNQVRMALIDELL